MTEKPTEVAAYIKRLDREAEQEKEITEDSKSFFSEAPENAIIQRRAREFEDVEKHIVRREHWVPILRRLHKSKGRGLRLLTLPGRHRLEVALYQREGLLGTSVTDSTCIGVVGYETEPATFGMLSLERPPFEMLENADVTVVLTEPKTDAYERLARRFPFDVINLDFTVPLATPSDGPYSRALRAISSCLRLQATQTLEWALFVTFRSVISETSPDAIKVLSDVVDANLENPQVKAAFFERFRSTTASTLLQKEQHTALGEFASKWIIDESHKYGWRVIDTRHIWYSRKDGLYIITKLMFVLRRAKDVSYTLPTKQASEVAWHVDDVVNAIRAGKREDVSAKLDDYRARKAAYVDELERDVQSLLSKPYLEQPLDPYSEDD